MSSCSLREPVRLNPFRLNNDKALLVSNELTSEKVAPSGAIEKSHEESNET
jgi:hypothetical protein